MKKIKTFFILKSGKCFILNSCVSDQPERSVGRLEQLTYYFYIESCDTKAIQNKTLTTFRVTHIAIRAKHMVYLDYGKEKNNEN